MSSSALVIAAFHNMFYNSGQWVNSTRWLGVPVQKYPLDLWVYQEILFEVQPDLIIETGTCYGGSALFMASMCDILKKGHVVTIDIAANDGLPQHDRISYVQGSSLDPAVLSTVAAHAKDAKKIMVVLDSDHSKDYVLREMRAYAPYVSSGSYMVVEDTAVNGHPLCPDHGPGPFEAIEEFYKENSWFQPDYTREKFILTQNPGGYLRRM
jgi:cephalosporin hydroxylase